MKFNLNRLSLKLTDVFNLFFSTFVMQSFRITLPILSPSSDGGSVKFFIEATKNGAIRLIWLKVRQFQILNKSRLKQFSIFKLENRFIAVNLGKGFL